MYYNAPRPAAVRHSGPPGQRFQALNAAKGAVAAGWRLHHQEHVPRLRRGHGRDLRRQRQQLRRRQRAVRAGLHLPLDLHAPTTAGPSATPTIYSAPFFKGAGFIGVKYLKSPEVNGTQVGLTLFGATTNGGEFSDPRNTQALYRYLSGTPDPTQGDDQCNVGNVAVTKICYINQGTPADMRFFQSSGPLTLAPRRIQLHCRGLHLCRTGRDGSLHPAQLLRPADAAVADQRPDPAHQPAGRCPAGPTPWTRSPGSGAGRTGPSPGRPRQARIRRSPPTASSIRRSSPSCRGSLLGKALTAQAIFDGKFVSPAPPTSPDFFLIPGDNQVTIVWRPSLSEDPVAGGDPYFTAAQSVGHLRPQLPPVRRGGISGLPRDPRRPGQPPAAGAVRLLRAIPGGTGPGRSTRSRPGDNRVFAGATASS